MRREKYFAEGAEKKRSLFCGKGETLGCVRTFLGKKNFRYFYVPSPPFPSIQNKNVFYEKRPGSVCFSDPLFYYASFERRTYAKQYAKNDVQ